MEDLLNVASERLELERLANLLELKLTPMGALNLLAVSMRIAPRDPAITIMNKAVTDLSIGMPVPPLMTISDEATWWTSLASTEELKYYAAAIFNALSQDDKAAFMGYARKVVA
jgi:hypothetical protein